jgi:hypothetical protein
MPAREPEQEHHVMDLPLADAAQAELAKRIFHGYLTLPPDEWAAHFAHTIGASSFADYRYEEPIMHDWIQQLHRLLLTPGAVEQARHRYLTRDERARIASEQTEF